MLLYVHAFSGTGSPDLPFSVTSRGPWEYGQHTGQETRGFLLADHLPA